MKIAVIGTGYVGLVSGTGFSEMGNDVTCVDIDEKKISLLKEGILPIYEPGLSDLVSRNFKTGRLKFTTNMEEAIEQSEILFIAVGTPPDEDGHADLQHVLDVARVIGQNIREHKIVVTKSTVPVGTSKKVEEVINGELRKRELQINFDLVSNPEFLKEGAALEDFMRPDRIILGLKSDKAKEKMTKLYAPFVSNGHPIYFMDIESSEMTKYAANAMLATKISFINEIALLCEKVGADVSSVRKGIGSDSRIGFDFIYAGLGYGGSCFPKDVKALLNVGREKKHEMKMLQAVEEVNQFQRKWFVDKVIQSFEERIEGKTFAIWGLAFKPGTDDMREAPSVEIINKLLDMGAKVRAYDPIALETAKKAIGGKENIIFMNDAYTPLEGADALLLLTEWREFRHPNFEKMKALMNEPRIFDGRNQFDPEDMGKLGFYYFSVGRKLSAR